MGVSVSKAEAFWMKVVYWVLCCEATMAMMFILVEVAFVWGKAKVAEDRSSISARGLYTA